MHNLVNACKAYTSKQAQYSCINYFHQVSQGFYVVCIGAINIVYILEFELLNYSDVIMTSYIIVCVLITQLPAMPSISKAATKNVNHSQTMRSYLKILVKSTLS